MDSCVEPSLSAHAHPVDTSLASWDARLRLSFEQRAGQGTVLAERWHQGPLQVQKALYPEGPKVCHVTLLHPPSGIAGGDQLEIEVTVKEGAHAVLSTPGATRWYKANGRPAAQTARLDVMSNASLEWLPQENIFFEHADARSDVRVSLRSGSRAIGWEIIQLGTVCRQTAWDAGRVTLGTTLMLDDEPLWIDAATFCAPDPIRRSVACMAGFPVMGTLWAFGPALDSDAADQLGAEMPWTDTLRAGFTHIPSARGQCLGLLRVLGVHAQEVRELLISLWVRLRPMVLGIAAQPLRLWRT
ncbi:urease accessory protein [Allopusillimonas ginsengisoli]|nr:urease accessory protein [Allopusillimonas ginsengisoli]